jgi:hypothetical protein
MSDERAAAHIQGIYFLVGTVLGTVLGGGGVGALWLRHEGEKPVIKVTDSPKADRVLAPQIKLPAARHADAPPNPVIQANVIEQPKPKPEPTPEPTNISLFEYVALRDDKNGSAIERINAIDKLSGKTVDWFGYFGEISTIDRNSSDSYFSTIINWSPDGGWGFWCYAPEAEQLMLSILRSGQPIRIKGLLKYKNGIYKPTIELVEKSDISMDKYLGLLKSETALIKVSKQYVGKHMDWAGNVESLQTYPNDHDRRYRLVLIPKKEDRSLGYIYCYLSAEAESRLDGLSSGTPVRVTGVLTGETDLKLTSLKKQ